VLLEAGPSLNGAAIEARLVNKFVLFYAPKIAGGGKVPLAHAKWLDRPSLEKMQVQQIGPDLWVEVYPRTTRK
jgi:diaminohydroxyphosphoribosylaminopyrimidine deaminase / 5-amino-6-(5-phosphoribosylamino)uracil reductase